MSQQNNCDIWVRGRAQNVQAGSTSIRVPRMMRLMLAPGTLAVQARSRGTLQSLVAISAPSRRCTCIDTAGMSFRGACRTVAQIPLLDETSLLMAGRDLLSDDRQQDSWLEMGAVGFYTVRVLARRVLVPLCKQKTAATPRLESGQYRGRS